MAPRSCLGRSVPDPVRRVDQGKSDFPSRRVLLPWTTPKTTLPARPAAPVAKPVTREPPGHLAAVPAVERHPSGHFTRRGLRVSGNLQRRSKVDRPAVRLRPGLLHALAVPIRDPSPGGQVRVVVKAAFRHGSVAYARSLANVRSLGRSRRLSTSHRRGRAVRGWDRTAQLSVAGVTAGSGSTTQPVSGACPRRRGSGPR